MASSDLNSLGEGRAVGAGGGGLKHRETCRTKPKHYGCNTMGVIALAKEASMICHRWRKQSLWSGHHWRGKKSLWSDYRWREKSMWFSHRWGKKSMWFSHRYVSGLLQNFVIIIARPKDSTGSQFPCLVYIHSSICNCFFFRPTRTYMALLCCDPILSSISKPYSF